MDAQRVVLIRPQGVATRGTGVTPTVAMLGAEIHLPVYTGRMRVGELRMGHM